MRKLSIAKENINVKYKHIMKYKIQMKNAIGLYGDMKVTEDDINYNTELFDNKKDAIKELETLCEQLNECKDDYRIVKETIKEDINYYE